MQHLNHVKVLFFDHCIYKCCGLAFNVHNKYHVLGLSFPQLQITTHLLSHLTLYVTGRCILCVMTGIENLVPTTPPVCSSRFGGVGRRAGVCR